MAANAKLKDDGNRGNCTVLKVLQPRDIAAIDEALGQIGNYGEVHLVIENGRLRFIRTVRSEAIVGTVDSKGGR
ncbi:MAG: hypothetical protein HY782_08760 [Chloroflexi bacterium]|nr:hypothetical protein [Chloroflexota bacterium]